MPRRRRTAMRRERRTASSCKTPFRYWFAGCELLVHVVAGAVEQFHELLELFPADARQRAVRGLFHRSIKVGEQLQLGPGDDAVDLAPVGVAALADDEGF